MFQIEKNIYVCALFLPFKLHGKYKICKNKLKGAFKIKPHHLELLLFKVPNT